MMHCAISTNFLVELYKFPITYVDPDDTGKWVGKNITEPMSSHWPRDDE
jgi:hypothetical protein